MKKSKWIIANYDEEKISQVALENNVPKFMAAVILSKGLGNKGDMDRFINCDETLFHNPFLLKDMDKAVDRIDEALENGEKITVYGDYDADGVTATYILYTYLKTKTDNVSYYIPDRMDEGYGLSNSASDIFTDTDLIITVDTGITACEQVEYAKEKGVDVIITDHHTPLEQIPDAVAVIDHKQADCLYPYKELAGVGVALKLVYALADCDISAVKKYFHIAAIGTVADLAELTGENRYIVRKGLENLKRTDNVGLKALFDVSGIEQKNITAANIGYNIGPMLNAAGRVASPYISLDLLLCEKVDEALRLAEKLRDENDRRKNEEKVIFSEAMEIIEKEKLNQDGIIVVSGEGWHHGVIGIVASRITEHYYKPAIVVSFDGDVGKASCRSIDGFNLFEAINSSSDYLEKFGGHKMAAGLTVLRDKLEAFKENINEYAKDILTDDMLTPKIYIDCCLDIGEFSVSNAEKQKMFEPYGVGNKTPVYCVCDAKVVSVKKVKNHVFLNLEKDGVFFSVPAFNMLEAFSYVGGGDIIDIAGTMGINEYNGVKTPQIILKDWRYSDKFSVRRDDVAKVYRILSKIEGNTVNNEFLDASLKDVSLHKVGICMNIMKELDILDSFEFSKDEIFFEKGSNFNGKTVLENSETYKSYRQKERR